GLGGKRRFSQIEPGERRGTPAPWPPPKRTGGGGPFDRPQAGERTPPQSAQTRPPKSTPPSEEHQKPGARPLPLAGWEMPVQYAGIAAEHTAVRTAAGLFDVSHMGEIEMRGEHAAAVVDYLVTGDAANLADGRALYTCACNERGAMLDDLIV